MKTHNISKRLYAFLLSIAAVVILSCGGDEPVGPVIPTPSTNLPDNSTIPYIRIDTQGNAILSEPKVIAAMEVFVNQESQLTTPIGIEFRGSTSFRIFDKKSYGIETRDAADQDIDLAVLGFPEEEDWVLQGPFSDKTLFRNVLIYQISNEMGRYAPRTRFVELEINGDYLGVYAFMEKIKREDERVNIAQMSNIDNSGDAVTGGYILKIDKTAGDTDNDDWPGDADYSEFLGFRSAYNPEGEIINVPPYGPKQGPETYFLYEYPKNDNITDQQKAYIQQYIADFENALLTDDFNSTGRTYLDYIDVESFADFLILNEISANPDGYRLSTYMHKQRGGKLAMGPIWDFNLAFGNDGRSTRESWTYRYNDTNPGDLWLVHFWWTRLMEDPVFRAVVKDRWNTLKSSVINSNRINSMIDAHVQLLDENDALQRNYQRWPVIGQPLPFNSFVGATYEDEVQYVKDWINDRIRWMDQEIQSF